MIQPVGVKPIAERIVLPVLAEMEREDHIRLDTRATRMLLAICGQEADWRHRDQVVAGKPKGRLGPATGLWQFERGGGVKGVLTHALTAGIARRWCMKADVVPESAEVWKRLVTDDRLACAFARLLLLTDPKALPRTQLEGWNAYLRCWRPGKPHRDRWTKVWDATETWA